MAAAADEGGVSSVKTASSTWTKPAILQRQKGQQGDSLPLVHSWKAHCTQRPWRQLATSTATGRSMQIEHTLESSSDHSEPDSLRAGELSPDRPPSGLFFFFASAVPAALACRLTFDIASDDDPLWPRGRPGTLPLPMLPCLKPANAQCKERGRRDVPHGVWLGESSSSGPIWNCVVLVIASPVVASEVRNAFDPVSERCCCSVGEDVGRGMMLTCIPRGCRSL